MKPLRAGSSVSVISGSIMPGIMRRCPGYLAGVCDASADRAQLIADRHGVQAWTTMADLLAQVDLVSVAVPTSAHFAAAKACLDAGKHVLVESRSL